MELTAQLGTKIIGEAKKLINENIIITNTDAIIIASTDPSRIGDFHEGAKITIENNSITILTKEHQKKLAGIRPGVNLPISIDQNVIGVIGITGDPSEITPFASLMQKMTELLIQESIYVREAEWKSRSLENFFLEWIQLESVSSEFIQRAEVFGITHTAPLRCTLIDIKPKVKNYQLQELINWLELHLTSTIVRWGNNRLLMITKEVARNSKQYLKTKLEKFQTYANSQLSLTIAIGIGPVVKDKVIKPSYQKAEKAIRVARNADDINFFEDLLLEICLDDIDAELKQSLIQQILKPLQPEADLLQTLISYLHHDLHIKKTAANLHIHINTLHYRLKRIEQLTNLNPKETYSITTFYTALYFLDKKTI
ncbi:carbohydrate diacid regulator [Oceanobacillus limi]|uniref:Carbohydrate diacid regulator n=1 Tax=Oceanobacillus limi TaxID=930131 RepID=A0A1I0D8A0_9BACI|nr:sugar diacid recognition domain-containing protein [Oceanobacillus limi]SET28454.1 carbohydrate diacid regulator [Oceanobacillus limi]